MIASHSNSFFDVQGVNVYRCRLSGGFSDCALVSTAADKHAILLDLGYRPSDILQANYVIWVEGPSDRIYINHWIRAKAPDLKEGLHYAIMFYGGRLLAHLSYDDPMVEDFIRLSCLNRNTAIVIDSDRCSPHGHLNNTKTRVKKDFESNSCLVWATRGRTIENYIPETTLNKVISVVHPKLARPFTWARFADVTHLRKDRAIDKVSMARQVENEPVDYSLLDLDAITNRLIQEIREHN